jgi:hypothetical protein
VITIQILLKDYEQYITIHARHGDFGEWCGKAVPPEDCFAPLSAVVRRVQSVISNRCSFRLITNSLSCREVQKEVLERHGVNITMQQVIMTSDETNEAWWEQVASYGWKRIDHAAQQTAERYSRWSVGLPEYPSTTLTYFLLGIRSLLAQPYSQMASGL